MFLSNPAKILHATFVLSLFFAGCTLWRRDENPTKTFALPSKKKFPFATREPEVFQAEIVIRTGDVERQVRIARDGQKRRIDYDPGTDNHRAVVTSDKEYVLFLKRTAYTEQALSAELASGNELASHLLNLRDYSEFEELGRDGSVIQFRARINESTSSDVLIFFDETIGLPVRQEFYSIDGEKRELKYAVELRNFRTEVDPAAFQVPAGFRRESQNREP